ncbi:MAG TPA: ABC transporter substrate-binding protein [Microvirga sp.]|nr:ABC transporter substrate-binding protein [Microvirga sp.]
MAVALSATFSAAQAAPQGVLRVAIGADPQTFDPAFNDLPVGNAVDLAVLEGLFRLDPKNNVQKVLATDYSFSPDGRVFTVKIKTGKKFSNGDPLNAEAVAASFNRLLDEKVGSIYRGLYASLGVAKAVGEDTVEFHLTEPNGHILMLLASTAASIVNVKAVQAMGAEYGRKPVGSGPYMVQTFVGSERFRLVPNPTYAGEFPATLQAIEFTVVPEDGSRMALLETDSVDVVERVPPESMPAINALQHAKVINPPSMFSINMEMVLRGPLQDLRVRRALNLAIDREGMTKGILGGLGTPSVGMVGPGTQDELRRTFAPIRFDPEGAKKLLAEAGYRPGSLSLTLTCPNGRYIKDAQVCQAIAGSFENVGVKATANVVDRGTWSKIVGMDPAARTDNMGMVGRATAGMDYTLYRLFRTGVGANRTGYSNPRVDELLTEGRRTTDLAKQKEIYGEIQEIIWNEAPFVFLWYQTQALGVANKVQGLEVQPNETLVFDKVTMK